jgi:hypothetical protein
LRKLEQRRAMLDADVVDEYIQRADDRLGVCDTRRHGVSVRDIERHRVDTIAAHLAGCHPRPVEIGAVEDNDAAGLEQALRERAADASAGACYERSATADVEQPVSRHPGASLHTHVKTTEHSGRG